MEEKKRKQVFNKNDSHPDMEYQEKLDSEFSRLKQILGISEDLKLEWIPNKSFSGSGKELSGEVINNVVFIYEEDFSEALKTLKHELIDYQLSRAIEPYKEVTNKLISLINDEAYKKKEKLVEALCQLIK